MTDWEVICPTRGRADSIGQNTLKILPSIKYAILEEEAHAYEAAGISRNQMILHNEKGLTNVEAWLAENRKTHTLITIDDDMRGCKSMVGQRQRMYTEEEDLLAIMENGMEISRDLGVSLFFWNQSANPINYHPESPLLFFGNGAPGGVYGINGRKLVHDRNLPTRADLDIVLQAYLIDRFPVVDTRFFWFGQPNQMEGKGGMQLTRTSAGEKQAEEYLKAKWGRYLTLNVKKRHLTKATGVMFNFKRHNPLANKGA